MVQSWLTRPQEADKLKQDLKVLAGELMGSLVDVRWEIEKSLKGTAWGFPSYGWDWAADRGNRS